MVCVTKNITLLEVFNMQLECSKTLNSQVVKSAAQLWQNIISTNSLLIYRMQASFLEYYTSQALYRKLEVYQIANIPS